MSRSLLETPPKSEPYHHGNLHAALLEAARTLVEELGMDGFSLRELARRAGVSPAAPYHHFKDKSALIRALAEESQVRLGISSHQAIQGIIDPTQKLSALGVAYVLYAFDHPSEFRIMFRQELKSPLGKPQTSLEQNETIAPDPAFQLLKDTLIECRQAGCIPITNEQALEIASINMWALVHGLATLIIDGPLSQTIRTREQVIELTRQITGGLGQPIPSN
jgi:AcrR family transcriptional regulator